MQWLCIAAPAANSHARALPITAQIIEALLTLLTDKHITSGIVDLRSQCEKMGSDSHNMSGNDFHQAQFYSMPILTL